MTMLLKLLIIEELYGYISLTVIVMVFDVLSEKFYKDSDVSLIYITAPWGYLKVPCSEEVIDLNVYIKYYKYFNTYNLGVDYYFAK